MNGKQRRTALLGIFFIFTFSAFHSCFCQQAIHQNTSQISINKTRYSTIRVLTVFYPNTVVMQILQQEIDRMKNGIELAREFFWRNSAAKLNLKIDYLEISEFKSVLFFNENGSLASEYVQQDIERAGIDETQFGIIVLIYPPPFGDGRYGVVVDSTKFAYAYIHYPVVRDAVYPGENAFVNYYFVFPFVDVLLRSLNRICYENSTIRDVDKPFDYAHKAGEKFSYQAELLRNFTHYLQINGRLPGFRH